MASALGSDDASKQLPTTLRQAKPCGILGTRYGNFSQARLDVRALHRRRALPKVGRLAHVVVWGERLLILPDGVHTRMVLQVLPDTRQMLDDRDAQALQLRLIADPRLHEDLGRLDGAEREYHFESCANAMGPAIVNHLHAS